MRQRGGTWKLSGPPKAVITTPDCPALATFKQPASGRLVTKRRRYSFKALPFSSSGASPNSASRSSPGNSRAWRMHTVLLSHTAPRQQTRYDRLKRHIHYVPGQVFHINHFLGVPKCQMQHCHCSYVTADSQTSAV